MKSHKQIKRLHINNKLWLYVVDRSKGRWQGEIRIYKENKTHKSLVYVTNIVKYFKPFQICVLYFCMLI
jgi:hypothetical protein